VPGEEIGKASIGQDDRLCCCVWDPEDSDETTEATGPRPRFWDKHCLSDCARRDSLGVSIRVSKGTLNGALRLARDREVSEEE
jgi:hypothetical protein